MSIVKDFLKKTTEKINKPTLTRSQTHKALSKKVTTNQVIQDYQARNAAFLEDQTLMITCIDLALKTGKRIFPITRAADQPLIHNICKNLTKLRNSYTDKVRQDRGVYEEFLNSASTFLERLCTLGFGSPVIDRSTILLYTWKLVNWSKAAKVGGKDNFLWVNYGDDVVMEVTAFEEVVQISHTEKPNHGERVLLYTYEGMKGYLVTLDKGERYYEEVDIESNGELSYYDAETKQFILDDGIIIKAVDNLKWISYDQLTKTL